jgi:hypothetical protein
MKNLLKYAVLSGLILSGCTSQSNIESEENVVDNKIDIFILAGQSNMDGCARIDLLDSFYHMEYDIPMYHKGKLYKEIYPGLGAEKHFMGAEVGIASYFVNSPKKIGFIKYAVGGTTIGVRNDSRLDWHGPWDGVQAGELYTNFFLEIEAGLVAYSNLGFEPVIRGMAWLQGESDGDPQATSYAETKNYENNLQQFFWNVRNNLHLPDLPIAYGQIYPYSSIITYYDEILQAQKNVSNIENNYFLEVGDLRIDPNIDAWHYQGNDSLELGRRLAQELYRVNYLSNYQNGNGSITGFVRDQRGNALTGATLNLDGQIVTSSADGSFSFNSVSIQDTKIVVTKNNYSSYEYILPSYEFINNKAYINKIWLHALTTIRGKVLDNIGNPISNCRVSIGDNEGYTDANGNYRIENTKLDSYNSRLTFSKTGYSSKTTLVSNLNNENELVYNITL